MSGQASGHATPTVALQLANVALQLANVALQLANVAQHESNTAAVHRYSFGTKGAAQDYYSSAAVHPHITVSVVLQHYDTTTVHSYGQTCNIVHLRPQETSIQHARRRPPPAPHAQHTKKPTGAT